ncbi:MAG: beta strand repeat-containing protein, partial [Rhodoluna sp.]
MTKKTLNSKVVRAGAILSALLMVLLPSTGIGNFASVANAVTNDQDTSLSTFTVDGTAVTDGAVVDVAYGTTAVDVVATPTNQDALVDVSGETGLLAGSNTVSVLVTAADDVTTQTYSVTVNVAGNDDTSLGVFTVNGDDVVNGGSVSLNYGTTEVEVVAEPTDVEATVVISGDTELVTGANTLEVVVTADDGTTTQTYSVTLNVAENNDTGLAVLAVNENDVASGDTVNLDWGTTEVEVVAEATDEEAVVVITGGSSLVTGRNTLIIEVTAADGTTTQTYTVFLTVAQNNDTSLAVFAVNGEDVANGSTVTVPNGTTSVTVIAETTDENALAVVTGDTGLSTGNNTLTVTVYAEDNTIFNAYTVTVVVSAPAFSNDTSLQTFTVDGSAVGDGGAVTIAQGRNSVLVEAVPTNQYATAVIAGNTGLNPGPNTVTVTVTADDGTVKIYTVTVTVNIPSSDATIASVKIDGTNFTVNENGTSVYNASFGTESLTVAVTTSSNTATFTVTGNTGLAVGENTVTIAVEAEDGTDKTYTFKIEVAAADTNTGLASFKVNGSEVTSGDSLSLPFGTTEVTVDVETSSATSTFTILGSTSIPAGASTLTVTVTAQSGAQASYTIDLTVLPASSDKSITSITVNGLAVTDNAITLSAGTTEAVVLVNLGNAFASYTVSGTSTVTTGANNRTITVTAQNGSSEETTLVITVAQASTDNTLASITVDDVEIEAGDTVSKPNGTASVVVVAAANSDKATVVVA